MALTQTADTFYDIWANGVRAGLVPGKEREARNWFREQGRKVVVPNDPESLFQKEPHFIRRTILPGFMYVYAYDAKHKATLPYYDKFPLVFPFQSKPDGFLGLNLHYLDRPYRARLMDRLHELTMNKKYNDNQRLALSYGILKGAARFRAFQPCVHRYLTTHIRSRFYKIPGEYWDTALWMPLERFQGASKSKVWSDSIRKIVKARR
jgi:hypothetical protein